MQLREPEMQWGPIARGIYIALLWLSIFLAWVTPTTLMYYIPFLIFLGLGLRPLLERTGLYRLFNILLEAVDERRWKKRTGTKRREVERKERDKTYKHRHQQDPRLPKNW